jgi:mannose-6-phosphate isomerase-like protein (cupin superfamily)
MNSPDPILFTPPGQAPVLRAFGEEVALLVDGKKSGGAYAQWMETTPPGGGPPPHYHVNEDEHFFVIDGTVSFYDGRTGSWTTAGPGWSALMPRGAIHTFKNTGDRPLKLLITTTPSGFETFFARCADVFAQPGSPDMALIMAISAEHGIHFVAS